MIIMNKNYTQMFLMLLLFITSSIQAQDYMSLLQSELEAQQVKLGLQPEDISEMYMYSQALTKQTGVMHLYAGQKHNTIPIFNAAVNAAFRNGEMVYMSNTLEANISQRINSSSPTLNPLQAAENAASQLGLGASNFAVLDALSTGEFLLSSGNVSLEQVPVTLVYVPIGDELKLAWDLNIHTLDRSHWWSVRVDATSGEIIDQNDWVVSCTFEAHKHPEAPRLNNKNTFTAFKSEAPAAPFAGEQYFVFGLPLESPNHGEPSLIVDPQDPVASPFGWHDVDGVEGAEFTITRGNNVLAWDDVAGDNETTQGNSPDGGEELSFNFPFNFDTNPINMLEASTTNLFYWNNVLHDIFFLYGFDEENGNFQQTNYGGAAGDDDIVVADTQDGSDLNNANFATPPDGFNPRMQMFLFSASGDPGESLTILNGDLAGGYIGVPAAFGSPLPEDEPIEGTLSLVIDDNAGEFVDENDACDTIVNGNELVGNIAVITRGGCEFGLKVLSAEQEGAIAVIVVNNVPGDPIAMAPGSLGDQVTIPSIMVSQETGDALIASLVNGDVINASLLSAGPFQIDSSVDNGIIAHEYAHGVAFRLTGGRLNSNCMRTCTNFNAQGQCIAGFATEVPSEGWSDYFGLMLTMEEGDTGEDVRGIGTYAIGQPTDGVGIRPTAYSTDLAINPSNYDSVAVFENTTAPHPVGYVWTSMIWDMTWGLIEQYGFDPDFYNGTGGNNIAMQLVMDGLKSQPCNPGFVDARDAILAAVAINPFLDNDEERADVGCRVWTAFANRGLGWSADQGDWREREDGTSATDFPPDNLNPCNGVLAVDDVAGSSSFSVFPNPSNGEINISAGTPQGPGTVRIIDINGRVVLSNDVVLDGTVRMQADGLATGIYLLQIQTETATQTTKLIIE